MADTSITDPNGPTKMFLYVIGPDGGPQKVGISNHPERRLADLQSCNGSRLHIRHRREVPPLEAVIAEKYAHALLWERHTVGEWFDVTAEIALRAVDLAVEGVAAGRLPPGQTLSEYQSARRKGARRYRNAHLRLGLKRAVALANYRALLEDAAGKWDFTGSRQAVGAKDDLRRLHASVAENLGRTTLTILRRVGEVGESIGDLSGSYRQGHLYRARFHAALDHILCLTAA